MPTPTTPPPTDDRPRPREGESLELSLDSLGHGGEAVGRHDGFVHFVPFGVPGDRVRVAVTEVKRSFARSRIESILNASADRVTPRCVHHGTCGGCQLQHVSDALQVSSRRQVLTDVLQRIAGIESPEVMETVTSDDRWGYRHRITLHVASTPEGEVGIGFVDLEGTGLEPIASCDIASPRFAPILEALPDAAEEARNLDGRIELRTGHPAGPVHVELGPGTEALTSPLLRRLQHSGAVDTTTLFWREDKVRKSAPRSNPPPLRLETPWATWVLPPGVFYQVNPPLAIRMAALVREWAALGPTDLALDLYAGMGFLAAAVADSVKRIWALESSRSAVRSGETAMRRAGRESVRFVPGPVETTLPTMNVKGQLSVAILDPPRTGAHPVALESLIGFAPARIVYVSCEPATLARDIKRLAPHYRHVRSIPFDFFPHTYHFESVTLLERADRR